MDRPIQTRREAESPDTFVAHDIAYNELGQTKKDSLPYFSAGAARTSATSTNALFTTYTYDALGRLTAASTVVGTTSNAYDNWVTAVTDPKGNVKKLQNDAFGRLVGVVEDNNGTLATTTYAWNANETLATTTDA